MDRVHERTVMRKKRQKVLKRRKKVSYFVLSVCLLTAVLLAGNGYAADGKGDVNAGTVKTWIVTPLPPAGDGKSDPLLTLINAENPLPQDWVVDLVQLKNGHSIDRRAYPDLQEMMDDARAAGLDPLICSSYRTNEKQTKLFQNQVQAYMNRGYSESGAKKEAGFWVAVPGTSEHQSGLAADIVSVSNQNLNKSQEETATQKWLMENSWKYGFILRYPSDKSNITGIGYEPWHYRYVGKEAAKEIYNLGVCLEEYLSGEQ